MWRCGGANCTHVSLLGSAPLCPAGPQDSGGWGGLNTFTHSSSVLGCMRSKYTKDQTTGRKSDGLIWSDLQCVFPFYLYRQVPILVFVLVGVAEVWLGGDGFGQRFGGFRIVGQRRHGGQGPLAVQVLLQQPASRIQVFKPTCVSDTSSAM